MNPYKVIYFERDDGTVDYFTDSMHSMWKPGERVHFHAFLGIVKMAVILYPMTEKDSTETILSHIQREV